MSMTLLLLALLAFFLSLLPTALYFANIRLFRQPERATNACVSISLLIPARNEEAGIGACLDAALASQDVDLEIIVLDDQSTDQTAAIVDEYARRDPRVRLARGTPLPAGWCGKQHACATLASLATRPVLTFLDADVRLTPDALVRMAGFLAESRAALVSGFPRQETETLLEKLVVPMINWLLLSYLPISQMRQKTMPGLGAGCGQWFMTTKTAYEQVGGHGHMMVRGSMHDGIKLPRAYRNLGLMTDFCDATQIAVCRMYRTAGQVWNGFAKNAREGMGAPRQLPIWTFLLLGGHLLPWAILAVCLLHLGDDWDPINLIALTIAWLTCSITFLPRMDMLKRFRSSNLGFLLHPLSVLAIVSIQWYANVRHWIGRPVGWKGRKLVAG